MAKISPSISDNEKWLQCTRILLLKLHRKESSNWPMVNLIHNGSEIATWMGHSFKNKRTKLKATFLRSQHLFLNFKLQIIRLAQEHWSCMPTHLNSYFYSYTYETTYLTVVRFTKGYLFFCQFFETEKLWF